MDDVLLMSGMEPGDHTAIYEIMGDMTDENLVRLENGTEYKVKETVDLALNNSIDFSGEVATDQQIRSFCLFTGS